MVLEKKTGIVLLFVSTFASPAFGYSIPAHRWLTQRAVQEYRYCSSVLRSPSLASDGGKILSQANIGEDRAIHIKAVNWHFYHPTKDLGSGTLGLGHASLRWRFQALENRVKIGHSLKALGGLTHYIQDVTNPAHVAPIYHIVNDSFDNFNFTLLAPKFISDSECQGLLAATKRFHSYDDLLDSISRETLSRMDESFNYTENGKPKTITWKEAFWDTEYSSKSKQKGFGHYGRFGNKFGVSKNRGVTISPTVFDDFAKRQIRHALDATILMIAAFQVTHATSSRAESHARP